MQEKETLFEKGKNQNNWFRKTCFEVYKKHSIQRFLKWDQLLYVLWNKEKVDTMALEQEIPYSYIDYNEILKKIKN